MRLDPQGLKATSAAASFAPSFKGWDDTLPVSEARYPALWQDDELPFSVPTKKVGIAFARKGAMIDTISTEALWKGFVKMNAQVGITVHERVSPQTKDEADSLIRQLMGELKERV